MFVSSVSFHYDPPKICYASRAFKEEVTRFRSMTRKFLRGRDVLPEENKIYLAERSVSSMKHNEQELWQRARTLLRRAQRKLDSARRDYERVEKMREELDQLRKSDEDREF